MVQRVRVFMLSHQFCSSPGSQPGISRASQSRVNFADTHVPGEALLRTLYLACSGFRFHHSGSTTMGCWVLCSRASVVSGPPDDGKCVLVVVRGADSETQAISSLWTQATGTA